jgi:hypothetical protein
MAPFVDDMRTSARRADATAPLRMDRDSQLVAAASHGCRSGAASDREPSDACPSSKAVIWRLTREMLARRRE